MKKIIGGIFVALVLVFAGWQIGGEKLLLRAMQKQIESNLSGETLQAMSGGLNVALCGAGSPMPDPSRAGPCTIIQAGDQLLVVDAGSGSPRNFGPMGIPGGEIDAVLLTHFHSDHIDGLGELMLQRWAGGGANTALPIYGPTGVEDIVTGFNQAYAQDFSYRVAHHGEAVMPRNGAGGQAKPFPLPAESGLVIYDQGGLKVTAFSVDHTPIHPAVGYRFDYQGRSIVISGDTVPTPALQKFTQDVDVFVSEALSPELLGLITDGAKRTGNERIAAITVDILNYHTTPIQAAQIAHDAHAGYLLLTHIVPPLPVKLLERLFLRGVDDIYSGPVEVGRDGSWLHLPTGSKEIVSNSLMRF